MLGDEEDTDVDDEGEGEDVTTATIGCEVFDGVKLFVRIVLTVRERVVDGGDEVVFKDVVLLFGIGTP